MTNHTLIISAIVLCSFGGWYVVLNKYFDLKDSLKDKDKDKNKTNNGKLENPASSKSTSSSAMAISKPATEYMHPDPSELPADFDFATENHIPGMGPAPLANFPFQIPPEVLEGMRRANHSANIESSKPQTAQHIKNNATTQSTNTQTQSQTVQRDISKREICNMATILHLSGLCFITGIPFLNIIVPTLIWLLKKEQHPYLAKQGREVINFQITFTMLQFLCLGVGILFIWLSPSAAASLFAWTKTARIVFSTSMQLPFNLFTVVPFFWACTLVLRGAVASYHGLPFKYPFAQQFLTDVPINASHAKQTAPVMQRKEPRVPAEPNVPPLGGINKIKFG